MGTDSTMSRFVLVTLRQSSRNSQRFAADLPISTQILRSGRWFECAFDEIDEAAQKAIELFLSRRLLDGAAFTKCAARMGEHQSSAKPRVGTQGTQNRQPRGLREQRTETTRRSSEEGNRFTTKDPRNIACRPR